MKKSIALLLAVLLMVSFCVAALGESNADDDLVIALLRNSLQDSDTIKYTFEHSEESDIYFIYVTAEGIAAAATLAVDNDTYRQQWNDMSDNMVTLNQNAVDLVKTLNSGSDAFVAICILNDLNPDNYLLTVLNGYVVYDVVNGIDTSGVAGN